MPFDGTRYERRVPSLETMDRLIDLLGDENRWCRGQLRSPDGRYCIAGAMHAVGATRDIKNAVLLAIGQVTGRHHCSIENFNDYSRTTHALVMSVLRQAREKKSR